MERTPRRRKLTSVFNVSLIYAVAPIRAAVLAWVAIGERVSRRTFTGSALALVGVVIIVRGSFGQINLVGDALAMVMTLEMAAIMVIYRAAPKTSGAGPSAYQSILLLPPSFLLGAPFQTAPQEIAVLAAFGLLFAIASVTLAEGAKRVPAGQTALIVALETPPAPALAFLILAEIPSLATLLGGGLVLLAVIGALTETRP